MDRQTDSKAAAAFYDLVFAGHVTVDEIVDREGSRSVSTGGAPFFGALAAAVTGKKIAVVTRMAQKDEPLLEPLRKAGVDVYVHPSRQTTAMRVVHPSANVDDRVMYQTENAGLFAADEMPPIQARHIHLGALTDHEFTVEFVKRLKDRGLSLSIDMQGFVRQVDKGTREIRFGDVPSKREIMGLVRLVKLDVVEARILTGTTDLEEASALCESWGSQETLITRSDGVLARVQGKTFFAPYTNRNSRGRTGRGDTTFGAYLAWRFDHPPFESLRFAAALASIKMEAAGPFRGKLHDVIARMNT